MSAAALTDIIQEIKWLGLPQVWSIRWVAVHLTVTWSVVSNVPMHTIVSLLYSGHRSASLVSMICITISICTPGLTNTVSNNIHKVYFDCLIVRRSGGLFYLPPRHSTSNYRDYWLSGINYIFRNSLFSPPLYRKLIGMELLSWHFPPILQNIFE